MFTLNVNGTNYQANVSDGGTPLLWVLRDVLGLTGTKYGCGIEICGACTVLVDGQPERSCDMDVTEAVGRKITTIEGLSPDGSHPVQQAWVKCQVPQCGFCQSGMIMATVGAMNAGQRGSAILPEVQNLCVCGTYERVKKAIQTL